jgi:hypothetical protein
MKLRIDECVDERLRLLFPGHECQTARFANLAGLKNGSLLEAAEAAGFDVLITVDQNIPDQQNLSQKYCPRDSLWADQPVERPRTSGAGSDFRDWYYQGRGRGKDPVIAALCARHGTSLEPALRDQVAEPVDFTGRR